MSQQIPPRARLDLRSARVRKTCLTAIASALCALLHSSAHAAPTLYTVGDSTVQSYTAGYYPRAGWGQMLPFFFDSTKVAIVNKAVGGTSSKSYYDNFWTPVKNSLKAGDYVTIQFGINDSAKTDPLRYTIPFTTFQDYLTLFVNETRAKGAFPILVSTQNRNAWNATVPPTVYPAYHDYPVATRQLAAELSVPLIDLDLMCTSLLEAVGPVYSTNFLYNHYAVGEWPNYPTGNSDDVHFQETGATEMAKLVVQGIRNLSGDPNVGKLIPFLKPTFKVTFNSSNTAAGTITRTAFFPVGITVTAKALPNPGFTFSGWSGDLAGTQATTTFVMDGTAKTIAATFQATGGATTYPAENAALSGTGTVVETVNAGYRGAGYVNFPTTGGAASFNNVNGGSGGSKTLVVRFALGVATARAGQLVVNGSTTSITFNPSGAWTTWSTQNVTVTLASGPTNTIRLQSNGQDLANIDEIGIQ